MMKDTEHKDKERKESLTTRLTTRIKKAYEYMTQGVWSDPRLNLGVRIAKTVNLTVTSFFNAGLQKSSMALTYSTVLSIVPAFALLVAIGRGFGLVDSLQAALYTAFPSQHKMIETAMRFVDSYLTSATQGVFVGVGIIMLLYTVVMLLSQIEDAFNTIWGVKHQRALYQKFTDYVAICLMIPVLMICSSGVSFLMSDFIQENVHLPFLSETLKYILGFTPMVLSWLAFSLSFYLIPNTKVTFKYAAISGAITALGFEILQLLFLNGQIYVSKYNAIYGSFAFLPLMLIWMQFSWLLVLSGCMLTYSMQNVFTFNLMGDSSTLSINGWHNMALIVMSVVASRFHKGESPLSSSEIAVANYLPVRIVGDVAEKLRKGGLIYDVKRSDNTLGMTPGREVSTMSAGDFLRRYDAIGESYVVSDFREIYSDFLDMLEADKRKSYEDFDNILVRELPLPDHEEILKMLDSYRKSPE